METVNPSLLPARTNAATDQEDVMAMVTKSVMITTVIVVLNGAQQLNVPSDKYAF